MEVKNSDTSMDCANKEEDDVLLPGFRFHPTDEELVGFYLRRKIEKKNFTIDLIKHVDIYKFDPWDIPRGSNVGDREWYFFCKRGRKYRNSVRPNRVTNSGFWKATGIDRPIYSTTGEGRNKCIGLKKSLVYYKGSAGKGTKTEWMMHEFRLPAEHDDKSIKHIDVKKITTQEAEVWTLCRILKRNTSTKKHMPDWRDLSSAKTNITPSINTSPIACSADSDTSYEEGYKIDFRTPFFTNNNKSFVSRGTYEANQICSSQLSTLPQSDSMVNYSNNYYPNVNEIIKTGGWDELKSVVEFDVDLPYM